MVIGNVGWGRKYHYTNLTPDEQYTHVTLWAMQASPLLIGCDMAVADKFTKSLLCNNEVIDINQDPLGYAATKIYGNSSYATYRRSVSSREPSELSGTKSSSGMSGGRKMSPKSPTTGIVSMLMYLRTEWFSSGCSLASPRKGR